MAVVASSGAPSLSKVQKKKLTTYGKVVFVGGCVCVCVCVRVFDGVCVRVYLQKVLVSFYVSRFFVSW